MRSGHRHQESQKPHYVVPGVRRIPMPRGPLPNSLARGDSQHQRPPRQKLHIDQYEMPLGGGRHQGLNRSNDSKP